MPDQYDKKVQQQVSRTNNDIRDLYIKNIQSVAVSASTINWQGETISLDQFPALKKRIKAIIDSMHDPIYSGILNSITASWGIANEKNDSIVDKRLAGKDPSQSAAQILYDPNLEALRTFITRKEKGLDLSTRVLNSIEGFSAELERSVLIGIAEGQSAATMAGNIKQYLKYPDKLFRRVRDAEGKLRLSKAAANFHPGQGVYRSSYQNALRLAATETNVSYRTADFERWQNLPFVIGIEVHTSGNHPKYDICDELKGKYPKDFLFQGWHPLCRCYQTSVQMTDDEYDKNELAILRGQDINTPSGNQVTDTPEGFKSWITDNSERIAGWKNTPYFIKNNQKYVKDLL